MVIHRLFSTSYRVLSVMAAIVAAACSPGDSSETAPGGAAGQSGAGGAGTGGAAGSGAAAGTAGSGAAAGTAGSGAAAGTAGSGAAAGTAGAAGQGGAPPCQSQGVPVVTQVSGALAHGQTITLDGCGFGHKPTAAPILWDDFEGGIAGDTLQEHSDWIAYRVGEPGGDYSNSAAYAGALAAHNEVFPSSGTSFNTSYQKFDPTDEVYLSYLFRFDVSGDPYAIMKLSRLTSNYDGPVSHVQHYNGPGDTTWQWQPHAGWSYASFNAGNDVTQTTHGNVVTSEWQRIEMHKLLSSPGGMDGQITMAQDNVVTWHEEGITTRQEGFDFQMNSILLGLMVANTKNDGHFDLYIDDIYVDHTLARVEIGDAPVFEDCKQREVQPPVAWEDTFVTITVNQGAFPGSAKGYLFVVDADGEASAGLPVDLPPS